MKKVILMAAVSLAVMSCKKTEEHKTVEGEVVSVPDTAGVDNTTVVSPTDSTTGVVNSADAETAKKFVEGTIMEVKLGNIAQQNAANAKVKEFGKMMISDHTKGGDELRAIASKKGWTVPAELGAEKKAKYDELAAKKGADFDKTYASFMVEDHKEDIEEYTKASNGAADADLKAYAKKTLPTLEHHLKMAKDAETAVK